MLAFPMLMLCARVAAVVAAVTLASPDFAGAALNLALAFLIIDWLLFNHLLRPETYCPIDSWCPALFVGMSRAVAVSRSGTPEDYDVTMLVEVLWCCACLCATTQAKSPDSRNRPVFVILNLQFLFVVCLANAPLDGPFAFAGRAAIFAGLCCVQYMWLPENQSVMTPRDYLLCFLPVLFASQWVAWSFSALSAFAVALGDASYLEPSHWPAAETPDPEAGRA